MGGDGSCGTTVSVRLTVAGGGSTGTGGAIKDGSCVAAVVVDATIVAGIGIFVASGTVGSMLYFDGTDSTESVLISPSGVKLIFNGAINSCELSVELFGWDGFLSDSRIGERETGCKRCQSTGPIRLDPVVFIVVSVSVVLVSITILLSLRMAFHSAE